MNSSYSSNINLSPRCDTINNDSITNASRATSGSYSISGVVYHTYGIKQYELSNHLGNVLATITDRHIPVYSGGTLSFYNADVASAQDYYSFGMLMPGRTMNAEYMYGYNGQERDDEISGLGNITTAEYWEFDSRLGRRWNLDPITKSWQSSYSTFNNNPIYFIDPSWDVPANSGTSSDDEPPSDIKEDTNTPLSAPKEGDTYTTSTGSVLTYKEGAWNLPEATTKIDLTIKAPNTVITCESSSITKPNIIDVDVLHSDEEPEKSKQAREVLEKGHDIAEHFSYGAELLGKEGLKEVSEKASSAMDLAIIIDDVWKRRREEYPIDVLKLAITKSPAAPYYYGISTTITIANSTFVRQQMGSMALEQYQEAVNDYQRAQQCDDQAGMNEALERAKVAESKGFRHAKQIMENEINPKE